MPDHTEIVVMTLVPTAPHAHRKRAIAHRYWRKSITSRGSVSFARARRLVAPLGRIRCMASWTDGAEYAPVERPDGFATPRVAPLEQAPAPVHPAGNRPVEPPSGYQPGGPAPSLEHLGNPEGPTRDPRQSFGTVTTAMTTSAWGSTHSSTTTVDKPFDPNQPMLTGDQPTALATLAPPTGTPVMEQSAPGQYPPAHYPLGQYPAQYGAGTPASRTMGMARALVKALSPALLISLALAILIPRLSFALLVVAIPLASRVPHAGQRLRRFAGIAAPVALLLAFLWNLHDDPVASLGTWSQVAAAATLARAVHLVWPRVQQSDGAQQPPPPPAPRP